MVTMINSSADYQKFMESQATELSETRRRALEICDKLAGEFPGWTTHDARRGYFAHIVNLCNTEIVAILATSDCLTNPKWLTKRRKSGGAEDFTVLIQEADKIFRKNAFLQAWALAEHAIRRIRTILIGIPATGPIYNHCVALYKTDLNHSRRLEFLDLIRLVTRVRNTSHNDFSYYPDSGGNAILNYKGDSFPFDVGKEVEFFSWSFVHARMRDLLELFEETVRHGTLTTIAHIAGR